MIVYSNSCSFGEPKQGHEIYPEIIASYFNADLVNKGRAGSCNRRIIRSTLRDLLDITQSNPDTEIMCLVGLSFIARTELWQPLIPAIDNDGNFHPIKVGHARLDWTGGLIDTLVKDIHLALPEHTQEYYRQWLIHMSKEAIITDLMADIAMFKDFCQHNHVKLLLWSNAQLWPCMPEVDVQDIFLRTFVQHVVGDPSVIDPWNFCFLDYALSLGHRPRDEHKYGTTGHPGAAAHADFARYLIKRLKELS